MKVVHVQKVKAFAGSEKYFLSLIPQQIKMGLTVHLVLVINESDKDACQKYLGLLKEQQIPYSVIPAKSDTAIFRTLRALKKRLRELNPDLVHSHLIHADLWCAILKKRKKLKKPLVSTKHGYEELFLAQHGFDGSKVPKNKYYRICKFSEKQIDKSFAVSEGLRGLFIQAGLCQAEQIQTIHHGFDLPKDIQLKEDCRYADQQILMLGRVIPFKGHHYGLEAFAHVVKSFPDVKCVIVGDWEDGYKVELDKIIHEKEITALIQFEGFQNNIYDYLFSSDILLVPSVSEGFGLVFLEGMNAEIPIVGFDVAATNEIVTHEESGILIPPYDCKKMGEELVHLLQHPEQRKKFARNAKKKLHSYFTLERMTKDTIAFYESVIQ